MRCRGSGPARSRSPRRPRQPVFCPRQDGLKRLYDLFAKAPWLGSLIDPRRSGGDVFAAGFSDIEPFLAPILAANGGGDEIAEMAVAAQGMSKAAELLRRQFDLVATNVPYLGRGKQDEIVSVNGGAKLVHPGGAKLVHLTLCGTRCWGVVPVVHRRDPRSSCSACVTRSEAAWEVPVGPPGQPLHRRLSRYFWDFRRFWLWLRR